LARPAGRARLQKLLAAAGVCSRRGAEALIEAGRVSVNGTPARLGDSADPDRDEIRLDGERLALEPKQYWIVHKPRGVLTTVRDTHGRPTILQLLPEASARVFPVGRLDRDTEGLVLLTNDGALAQALLHPSHGVPREYAVSVRGELRPREQQRLAKGVRLDDGITAPSRIARLRQDHEAGRMGPLRLGRLPRGVAREATRAERAALERLRAEIEGSPRAAAQRARSSGRKAGRGKGKRKASKGSSGNRVSH
jgi:23S rRNA pseudouridine2605 synthase